VDRIRVIIDNLDRYEESFKHVLFKYNIRDPNYLHNLYEIAIEISLIDEVQRLKTLTSKLNIFISDKSFLEISEDDLCKLSLTIYDASIYFSSKFNLSKSSDIYIETINTNMIILNIKENK